MPRDRDMEDEPLGGDVNYTRDATEPLDADSFDLGGFLGGKRTTRTAVLIPEKASLLGDIKKLEYRIDHAPASADVDDLIEQFEDLVGEYEAAQRFWTVEARSPEWVEQFRTEYAKANRLRLRKDGNPATERDAVLLLSAQIAEQVVEVEPLNGGEALTEVSIEQVVELYDDNAVLWSLLNQTMRQVNTQVPQDEAVLTRDFSQRSSTGRSGTAS
jgi:hypothetical protein